MQESPGRPKNVVEVDEAAVTSSPIGWLGADDRAGVVIDQVEILDADAPYPHVVLSIHRDMAQVRRCRLDVSDNQLVLRGGDAPVRVDPTWVRPCSHVILSERRVEFAVVVLVDPIGAIGIGDHHYCVCAFVRDPAVALRINGSPARVRIADSIWRQSIFAQNPTCLGVESNHGALGKDRDPDKVEIRLIDRSLELVGNRAANVKQITFGKVGRGGVGAAHNRRCDFDRYRGFVGYCLPIRGGELQAIRAVVIGRGNIGQVWRGPS